MMIGGDVTPVSPAILFLPVPWNNSRAPIGRHLSITLLVVVEVITAIKQERAYLSCCRNPAHPCQVRNDIYVPSNCSSLHEKFYYHIIIHWENPDFQESITFSFSGFLCDQIKSGELLSWEQQITLKCSLYYPAVIWKFKFHIKLVFSFLHQQ